MYQYTQQGTVSHPEITVGLLREHLPTLEGKMEAIRSLVLKVEETTPKQTKWYNVFKRFEEREPVLTRCDDVHTVLDVVAKIKRRLELLPEGSDGLCFHFFIAEWRSLEFIFLEDLDKLDAFLRTGVDTTKADIPGFLEYLGINKPFKIKR